MSNISRRSFIGTAALGAGAVASAAALAGCDDNKGGDKGGSGDGSKKRKVAMFIDGPINDGGWGASCYDAMKQAADQHGWECQYTENVAQADWGSTMQNYIDQGYDLIIAPGNQYTNDVKQVAREHEDAHFCIFNAEVEDSANIECTIPDTLQIGQVAGALAGLMTATNHIGFIGGVELDTTKNKLEGYTAAAKAVNPAITDDNIVSAMAGSFSDAAKGKELCSGMINTNDIDVMFGDASVVDTGAREALVADTKASGTARYDIGQPGDLLADSNPSPCIICSVVTDNVRMTNEVMDDLEKGTFGKKVVRGDLKNEGVKVGKFSDQVPADIQEKFKEAVDKIAEGTLVK